MEELRLQNFGKIESFHCNQFSNINLIIGENGAGKTFLLKALYSAVKAMEEYIVAEGIESKEQVEFLTEHECDLIQGYFYAKPMPISEFEQKYNIDNDEKAMKKFQTIILEK